MTLTLRSGFVSGLRDLDSELRNFFAASTSYRAASGRGSVILILDEDEELGRLVRFLADRTKMEVRVVCMSDPRAARKFIEDSGESSVKAVIVDVELLSGTGASFYSWVRSEEPDVPIFMKGTRKQIVEFTGNGNGSGNGNGWRFGTFVLEDTTDMDYVRALGFPSRCDKLVREFRHEHAG